MLKWISRVTRDRRPSWLPMIGLLCLLAPAQQAAAASSSAFVFLDEPFVSGTIASDSQPNTSTPAVATLGGVTGSARSDLGTGSVGAGLFLAPGADFGFYSASASWIDAWTGSGVGSVPVAAAITLHGSIDQSLVAISDPFWEITFRYVIGAETVMSFGAFADSTIPNFHAEANGVDISSSIVFAPNAANPLLTDFSLTATPTVSVSSSGFGDFMEVEVRADAGGPLTLDAFHTFQVVLTSLDPSVTFTGEGGRTIASVPEPGTFALVIGGLGLLAGRRRRTNA